MAGTVKQSAQDVIIFSGGVVQLDKQLMVRTILWAGNTGASDDLKVHNYDSTVTLIETIAGASGCNLQLNFDPPKRIDGVSVSTIDSGRLFFYLA
jgi:hypothetical protein